MTIEKDCIISSHRDLICQLYRHIEAMSQCIKEKEDAIKTLKKTLIDSNIPLPDLHNEVNSSDNYID